MDPEVTGTAVEETPNDPQPSAETTAPETGATEQTPPAEAKPVESFINPADLPEELKPHWSRMHRAYTKAREEIKTREADIQFLDSYRRDPAVARQVLEAEARRLGLTLTTGSQPTSGQTNGTPAAATTAHAEGAPPELVKAIEDALPPELKWMAPAQAIASWKAAQTAVAPLAQKDQAKEHASRLAEYDRLAEELSATAPGWEEHEKTMNELLAYLRSPALSHPTFGSKLALLHGVVTKDARARVSAAESMAAAARNRTTTGQSGRSVTPNIADQVRQAPNTQAAIDIAAKAAIESLKAQGVPIPA
ncbi:MAG TPA: hypothetical protein VEA38_22050 [Terriglobales bacterium]|nr:hypothetical protein [Terriglobales bacterium]